MLNHLYDGTPYLFNPLAIQTLVVALAIIVLGVFALVQEQGSHVSIVFFVLALSIGVWLFGFSWMYSARDANLAMWWAKVAYVGIAFIPAAVYHFRALMLQEYERLRKRILGVWALSAIFIILIITTDVQFASLYQYPWGYYPRSGMTSLPFIFYFIVVMVSTVYRFAQEYRRAVKGSSQLTRARTLLISFALGYVASTDFIVSFGVPWYPIGYIPIIFFTVISARSILRYQFMAITPAFAARQIIDTMNDALIVLDPDGIVRLVNPATCRLFGLREQILVGKKPADVMVKGDAFAGQLESIIGRGTVRDHEVDYRTRENTLRTLSIFTSVMQNQSGEPLASVCVVSDITDRKRAEEEREKLIAQLQEANRKLQTLDKMKSDFVSVVSHELRTPLTTIKAFLELIIMKPGMSEQQRAKLMSTVNVETDRLTRLISDLLDLAQIEAGSMKWRLADIAIEDVIGDAVTSMEPLFENNGLRLTTAFNAPLSCLSGDRDRLVQVVTNLLSNAVKFTPAGGAIHIAVRQEQAPPAQVVVEISDTGAGIPPQDLELIFEKFHRSGGEHGGSSEGTGLGLAIARQIVEYHGGRIWAASTQGKGSTFTFTLPLSQNPSVVFHSPKGL